MSQLRRERQIQRLRPARKTAREQSLGPIGLGRQFALTIVALLMLALIDFPTFTQTYPLSVGDSSHGPSTITLEPPDPTALRAGHSRQLRYDLDLAGDLPIVACRGDDFVRGVSGGQAVRAPRCCSYFPGFMWPPATSTLEAIIEELKKWWR
jgi:hypothetical protein